MDHGWFRTGDLAVMHPEGYVAIRDRLKHVIISGGENISSVEVEPALAPHEAVLDFAVVVSTDHGWCAVPRTFCVLNPRTPVTTDQLHMPDPASLHTSHSPK